MLVLRDVGCSSWCLLCSEHQRSKSADNLTMRQLTKDDEKVLRRFVDPRHYREVGYDSDKTDLRSFHDAASQDIGGDQIFKPLGLGPLPPTPPQAPASTGCSRKHGLHSLREKMHLDGLVPCRPTLCRDESDDYAELDDVVGAGMGAEAGHTESDGFDVAGTFLVRSTANMLHSCCTSDFPRASFVRLAFYCLLCIFLFACYVCLCSVGFFIFYMFHSRTFFVVAKTCQLCAMSLRSFTHDLLLGSQ